MNFVIYFAIFSFIFSFLVNRCCKDETTDDDEDSSSDSSSSSSDFDSSDEEDIKEEEEKKKQRSLLKRKSIKKIQKKKKIVRRRKNVKLNKKRARRAVLGIRIIVYISRFVNNSTDALKFLVLSKDVRKFFLEYNLASMRRIKFSLSHDFFVRLKTVIRSELKYVYQLDISFKKKLEIEDFSFLALLPNVRSFSISNQKKFRDDRILSKYFPKLTSLSITNCISCKFHPQVLKSLRRKLSVSNHPYLNPKDFPNEMSVQELDLQFCPKITSDIFSKFPLLKGLVLHHCQSINDEIFTHLPTKMIEVLRITFCDGIFFRLDNKEEEEEQDFFPKLKNVIVDKKLSKRIPEKTKKYFKKKKIRLIIVRIL